MKKTDCDINGCVLAAAFFPTQVGTSWNCTRRCFSNGEK